MAASTGLPVTLEWYRDTFKWFVGLAAGILGFSVTLVKDHPIESAWTRNSFFSVCVCFGLSGLAGVWAYLWAIKSGNSRENHSYYKENIRESPTSPERAEWEKARDKAKEAYENEQKYLGISYWVMLGAFMVGVVAFSILAASLLFSKKATSAVESQAMQASIFLGEVGPFEPGLSTLLEACDKRSDVSSIVSQMSLRSKDLDYIALIGSADHRQIRTGSSNRILALRRALWTEYCLRQQLPPPLDSIMMTHSVRGPLNLGTHKEELMAEDRLVGVYAIVKVAPPPSLKGSDQGPESQ